MNVLPPPTATGSRFTRCVIFALFLLAGAHCVLSEFYVNFSYLDLAAYQRGAERNPYQQRVAMMPLLRFAHESAAVQRMAARVRKTLGGHPRSAFKDVTAEQLASMAASLAAVYAAIAFLGWYGQRRLGILWWLPNILMLAMLYVTLAARYETTVWFPYDLPHMAVFGLATIAILEGWWPAAFVLFLIDIPIRETSIYLASLTAAVAYSRRQWKPAVILPAAMFACWLAFRMAMKHIFAHNANETALHLNSKLQVLVNPVHWPQFASAFGFLLVPLLMGRRLLTREQRFFLLGAIPCLIVTLSFGVWDETRIFCEWIPAASILLSFECASFLQTNARSAPAAIL